MEKKLIEHEDLREGPIRDRSCTDILCALIFFAFVGAMITLGIFGYKNGDPAMILYPYDSAGNQCGRPDTNGSLYHYVYFVNYDYASTSEPETKYKVCLKTCPTDSTSFDDSNVLANSFVSYSFNTFTVTTIDGTAVSVNNYIPYASKNFLKRVCIPLEISEEFKDYIQGTSMMSYGSDIVRCWYMTLAVLGIAVGISLIYLLLMRYFIGFIVWVVIAALIVLCVLFGSYFNWQIYEDDNLNKTEKYEYWAIAIASYAVALLFLIIVICLRKRIELAIAIMKSATMFINDVWSSLLVPVIMFFISVGVFAFWILALVYLYSSGTLKHQDNASAVAKIEFDTRLKNALWFEFLGIIWIDCFKVALIQFIISFACCVWYFTANKDELDHPIWRGVKNGVFYHIGSLAFGSLVLALVILIKWFLTIMTKIHSEHTNPVVACMCKCVLCCVACFERFVKFLDHQAYIRIAMTGENFCTAAKNAFEMIWENAGRYAAFGGVSSTFNFLGKALITCSSTYLGFFIITHKESISKEITSPVGPTVVFGLVSYLVAALFMSVYEMAGDTIIQAFILDEKLNGEKQSVYAPEPLKEFMDEKDEREKNN